MYYWQLWIDHGEFTNQSGQKQKIGYNVYYKHSMGLSLNNVPKMAVKDGDLISTDIDRAKIKSISKEEYLDKMWE